MPKEETYNITVRVRIIHKSDNKRRLNTYVSLEGYTYGKETIDNRFPITDGFIGRATSGIKEKIGDIILTKAREMVRNYRCDLDNRDTEHMWGDVAL